MSDWLRKMRKPDGSLLQGRLSISVTSPPPLPPPSTTRNTGRPLGQPQPVGMRRKSVLPNGRATPMQDFEDEDELDECPELAVQLPDTSETVRPDKMGARSPFGGPPSISSLDNDRTPTPIPREAPRPLSTHSSPPTTTASAPPTGPIRTSPRKLPSSQNPKSTFLTLSSLGSHKSAIRLPPASSSSAGINASQRGSLADIPTVNGQSASDRERVGLGKGGVVRRAVSEIKGLNGL